MIAKGGYAMAMETNISELAEQHRNLEAAIDEELMRPHADTIRVSKLKKQKLLVKEQLNKLEALN